jgi:hypothetical protein
VPKSQDKTPACAVNGVAREIAMANILKKRAMGWCFLITL